MITVSFTAIILLFLLAVFLGAVVTLAAAALGALVVFRTKREPHESLFNLKPEKGEVFTLDDFTDPLDETLTGRGEPKEEDAAKSIIDKQTARFLAQLKAGKGMET